jgi:epoxyqueuosine reductase
MRDRLRVLQRDIRTLLPGSRALWYSDTGAILERGWAERAGLGWIGKHAGLLSERFGSWFLLGEVLLDRVLVADPPPVREHCGSCRRCIDACPTGAIVAPYQLDARLCISYLTIELRGAIPLELRASIGDWVFGCDICQEVCPWNQTAPRSADPAWQPRRAWDLPALVDLLQLTDIELQNALSGSAMARAKPAGLRRNITIAAENATLIPNS